MLKTILIICVQFSVAAENMLQAVIEMQGLQSLPMVVVFKVLHGFAWHKLVMRRNRSERLAVSPSPSGSFMHKGAKTTSAGG